LEFIIWIHRFESELFCGQQSFGVS
jgi:hypothetical protein